MDTDLKKLFKKYILASFCEQYEIENVDTVKDDDLIYFRHLCFSYIDFIRQIPVPYFRTGFKNEAVFIEFRCFPHMEFIIRNAILKLGPNWSHTVICGNLNYDFVAEMCFHISPNIKVINTGLDNITANHYNIMLTSPEFWELLEGEKILIYQ